MMADVYLGLKRPDTLPPVICKKLLVVIIEVDIGPITVTLLPITQVSVVDFCIHLSIIVVLMIVFMKMQEMVVGVMIE